MKKNLACKNLFSVFFTLNTRNETKNILLKRTTENETDEQLICSFTSKYCNSESVYTLNKCFEFLDGFFVPHFILTETDRDSLSYYEENLNG